jgi:hypothetical protein
MAKTKPTEPIKIDPRLEFRGTSYLRQLTADALRELSATVVIQDGADAERLAVVLSYSQYLALQEAAGL